MFSDGTQEDPGRRCHSVQSAVLLALHSDTQWIFAAVDGHSTAQSGSPQVTRTIGKVS